MFKPGDIAYAHPNIRVTNFGDCVGESGTILVVKRNTWPSGVVYYNVMTSSGTYGDLDAGLLFRAYKDIPS